MDEKDIAAEAIAQALSAAAQPWWKKTKLPSTFTPRPLRKGESEKEPENRHQKRARRAKAKRLAAVKRQRERQK